MLSRDVTETNRGLDEGIRLFIFQLILFISNISFFDKKFSFSHLHFEFSCEVVWGAKVLSFCQGGGIKKYFYKVVRGVNKCFARVA